MLTPNKLFVSIHVFDKLNRNIHLLESNHQHTVQYFAVDEKIEHYKYHPAQYK